MFDKLIFGAARLFHLKRRKDDDMVDRSNYLYSSALMTCFCIVVSVRQLSGSAIVCFVPHEYSGAWTEYVNNYCWIKNTYRVHMGEDQLVVMPIVDPYERRNQELTYYQWVPPMLLIQALLFLGPCLLWRMTNTRSGINLSRMVSMTQDIQLRDPEDRKRILQSCARHLNNCLNRNRASEPKCMAGVREWCSNKCYWFLCRRRYGNFLTPLYLFCKLLYIANAIGQLFLLNIFLGTEYTIYGIEVLSHLIKGEDWVASYRFPRVTFCDYKIVQMWNIQPRTVQCVLPINLFNEKIYLFLWFWLLFIAILTFWSLCSWLWSMLCMGNRYQYVLSLLHQQPKPGLKRDKKVISNFINHHLRNDGVFTLRMLSKNSNDVIISELCSLLYDHYLESQEHGKSKKAAQSLA